MPKLSERVHLIPVDAKELAVLIRESPQVDLAFGVGGAALRWQGGEPMPDSVRRLCLMRGVLNENCDGAGI